MKFILKYLVALFFLSTTTFNNENKLNTANWLLGTWENKTPRGSVFETWNQEDNHCFVGKSYMIKEKDTLVFENIKLIEQEKTLYYIPVVKNQNDGLPVKFKASFISNEKLIFENPEHDFPQMITYTKINSDSLVAQISGVIKGKERKQTFPMKRIK